MKLESNREIVEFTTYNGKGMPPINVSKSEEERIVSDFIAYLSVNEKNEYSKMLQADPHIAEPLKKKGLLGLATSLLRKFIG